MSIITTVIAVRSRLQRWRRAFSEKGLDVGSSALENSHAPQNRCPASEESQARRTPSRLPSVTIIKTSPPLRRALASSRGGIGVALLCPNLDRADGTTPTPTVGFSSTLENSYIHPPAARRPPVDASTRIHLCKTSSPLPIRVGSPPVPALPLPLPPAPPLVEHVLSQYRNDPAPEISNIENCLIRRTVSIRRSGNIRGICKKKLRSRERKRSSTCNFQMDASYFNFLRGPSLHYIIFLSFRRERRISLR